MWIINSRVMLHVMIDIGDILDSCICSHHTHSHLLEYWNKLLEVVEESSIRLEGTLSKGSEELSKLNLKFYLEFELLFQSYDSFNE